MGVDNIFYSYERLGDVLLLRGEEYVHCVKVLRHVVGDVVYVTDGNGLLYECVIRVMRKDLVECEVMLVKEYVGDRDYYLHIGISLTKNISRFEFFLEKSVEIGVDEITILNSERSEREKYRYERLEKILISVCKQSLNYRFPVLNDILGFKELVDNSLSRGLDGYIAYNGLKYDKCWLGGNINRGGNYIVLIGPEGDFTDKEVEYAVSNGYKVLTLGLSRLRTETAGIYVVSAFKSLLY